MLCLRWPDKGPPVPPGLLSDLPLATGPCLQGSMVGLCMPLALSRVEGRHPLPLLGRVWSPAEEVRELEGEA